MSIFDIAAKDVRESHDWTPTKGKYTIVNTEEQELLAIVNRGPPGPKETPPEIAGLMIRAYENPLVSLISGGVR